MAPHNFAYPEGNRVGSEFKKGVSKAAHTEVKRVVCTASKCVEEKQTGEKERIQEVVSRELKSGNGFVLAWRANVGFKDVD